MLLKKITIYAVVVLLPAWGWAGYYQYRDASGVVHFTDAIAEVPENQRAALQIHQDLGDATPRQKITDKAVASGQIQGNPMGRLEDPDALENQLKTLKGDLDAAHREITDAKERLPSDPPASDDPASIDYARQIRDLNALIAAYEKKRQEYEKGVNAFNQEIQSTADGLAASESP